MRYCFIIGFITFFGFLTANAQELDSIPLSSPAQQKQLALDEDLLKMGLKNFDDRPRDNRGVRVAFYNVENLFDIEDDPKTNDDEFTPGGGNYWSYTRYSQKLANIYKTMAALGGWELPEIMGFCEIENRKVLEDLINKTPFQKYGYKIVHEDSPDARGIDVGLVYRSNKFKVLGHEAIRVIFPFDTAARTRDVLYVYGEVLGKDTLHIFVNHWPSRRGGQAASEPRRVHVASLVRAKADAIYKENPNAKIIIMGDFNDEYENISLSETLKAKHEPKQLDNNDFYNYMATLSKNWKLGSHKFQGHWGTLDHIIVSAPLYQEKDEASLRVSKAGAQIFAPRFLLEPDNRFMGLQPFRTYAGPRYLGGFSDHLPIYIDLLYKD